MRRSYAGAAPDSSLTGSIADTDMTLTLTVTTGWPDGSGGPFYVVLSPGAVNEEKALIASRVGDVCTVQSRGADGTAAQSHDAAAVVRHVFTATDADEANEHVNATADVHGVTGSLKGYIDTQISDHEAASNPHDQYVAEAGDTMTGELLLSGDPVSDLGAAPKQYVVASAATAESNAAADANAYTDSAIDAARIVGEVKMLAFASPPSGWLVCNGQAVSRSTYSALFSAIGTVFGDGNGTTTFNVPNLTDRVPMGGGTLGATGGQDSVTLTTGQLPSHSHTVSGTTGSDTHKHGLMMRSNVVGGWNGYVVRGPNDGQGSGPYSDAVANDTHSHSFSATSSSVGSGQAVDITPPHTRLAYVIYAG